MEQKNDGGAAFPQHGWSRDPEANKYMQDKGGMSLRDYFAAQAMQGLLACSYPVSELGYTMKDGLSLMQNGASFAYEMADAMLAERAK